MITPDKDLQAQFGLLKEGLIPSGILKRGFYKERNASIISSTCTLTEKTSSADLDGFVLYKVKELKVDACLLLVDQRSVHLLSNIVNSVFFIVFERPTGTSPQNFFHQNIAKLLKQFGVLASMMEDNSNAQLLSLPIRNFHASELREIALICGGACELADFNNALQQKLGSLRTRFRPRKKSTYAEKYLVDDKRRFFVFGKEKHARFATGSPHFAYCELAGIFRFGRRIDEFRHYNVSETEEDKTKIEGEFQDCHSQIHIVTSKTHPTHLNMFCNDYF